MTPSVASLDLTVGDSPAALTFNVLPANATNKELTIASLDAQVASYSQGKVTPVGAGETSIKATTKDGSNKTVSVPVTVKAAP